MRERPAIGATLGKCRDGCKVPKGWNSSSLRWQNRAVGHPAHSLSPSELEALLEIERDARPFLSYRDGAGDLRLTPLEGERLTLGRSGENAIVLDWDREVSRTHAELTRVGGAWTLADDGLSRNGCWVNGERLLARRRLLDGDVVRVGQTAVVFRAPGSTGESTVAAGPASLIRLTEAERRVLVELCRPLLKSNVVATPASNGEIAERLVLSPAGVKTHIRSLFVKLEVDDLPQNRKRAELARRALDTGLITARDVS
jgi:DNA-binding CsgD family transcriptional regulator